MAAGAVAALSGQWAGKQENLGRRELVERQSFGRSKPGWQRVRKEFWLPFQYAFFPSFPDAAIWS
jgi:hypothetical protein